MRHLEIKDEKEKVEVEAQEAQESEESWESIGRVEGYTQRIFQWEETKH